MLSFLEAMGLSGRIRVAPGKRMNMGLKVTFVSEGLDCQVRGQIRNRLGSTTQHPIVILPLSKGSVYFWAILAVCSNR